MKVIPLIWFVFTVIFLCFSGYHFVLLSHSYPRFEWEQLKGQDFEFENPTANENRSNLTKFIAQWNKYIEEQDEYSFWLNLVAAISYLFTAIMTFYAMLTSSPYNIKDTALYKRLFKHND